MKLIVGNMNYKLRDFIKKYQFDSRIMVINKMCNVKIIKEAVDIIIPFGKIENNGLITNTQVNFEELLMSVNVSIVKYGNPYNKNLIEKICNLYQVKCVYIDLNNRETSNSTKLML